MPGKLSPRQVLALHYRERSSALCDTFLTLYPSPETVIANGKIAAQNNVALFKNEDDIPEFTLNTVNIHPFMFTSEAYRLSPKNPSSTSAWIQAVEMYDGYFKRAFHAKMHVDTTTSPPAILCDPGERDILKICILDRHHGTKNRGVAFVRGFGLKQGAIATTTNCENQNLVIIGVDDASIAAAARAMHDLGGGMLAVGSDGAVLGKVNLDVAGCMSSAPWEYVRDASLELDKLVHEKLGCTMAVPFLIASFVGLVAVPDLGLTELGLVAGGGHKLIDPVLKAEPAQDFASDERHLPQQAVKVCCRCPSHSHNVHKLIDPESFE